jgi:hypothetical protein
MRRALLCVALALASLPAVRAEGGAEGARRAAAAFGSALLAGKADALRPLLPERGRVRLTLARLGPEQGSFGAHQVEALFRDFLAHGRFTSFDVARCEGDAKGSALAHAAATIVDRDGRNGRIALHLGLETEGGRWVLREVKESAE